MLGTYDLMNGASPWARCERVGRAECSDVSKVAREIDEGLPLRAMASRLESRTYSSLYDRYVHGTCRPTGVCFKMRGRA